jgi:hypothetical protein
MKLNTQRTLILTEHWASCAIAFGIGYWMLSYLQSGVALMIALGLAFLGAITKLIAHSRLQQLHDAAASESPAPLDTP